MVILEKLRFFFEISPQSEVSQTFNDSYMKEIIKKFRFKSAGLVINAPKDLEKEFVRLGLKTALDKKSFNINTVVFVNNKKEFMEFLTKDLKNIEHDSVLWFAYPKGSSGISTDINRDILRETAEKFSITTVTAISINETWSALRFRPIEKVGK
jgi:hypothetical protein